MKIVLLTLATILTSLYSFAYRSIFGKHSTQWTIIFSRCTMINGADTFLVEKDTVINGLTYKKIIQNHDYLMLGLMREDTASGKVWNISWADSTEEIPLFDFTLQKGDTFDVRNQNYAGYNEYPPFYDILKEVDSVYYKDGLKHIRFKKVNTHVLPAEPMEFIEGIGSNYSVLMKLMNTCFLDYYQLCTYKDGTKTSYNNLAFNGDCNPTTTVKSVKPDINTTKLYPLPANTFLQIETEEFSINSFELYDLSGKLVLKQTIRSPKQKVDVTELRNGLYMARLIATTGEISNKKVMILH